MTTKEAGRPTAFAASNRAMRNHPVMVAYETANTALDANTNDATRMAYHNAKETLNTLGHRLEDHYMEVYATARADGLDPRAAHHKAEEAVQTLAGSL